MAKIRPRRPDLCRCAVVISIVLVIGTMKHSHQTKLQQSSEGNEHLDLDFDSAVIVYHDAPRPSACNITRVTSAWDHDRNPYPISVIAEQKCCRYGTYMICVPDL